ncbi:MAG: transcription antitermination factor NusB [Actinobacteria bacterium]|nr:MAG: transcription antitermination factor NusB [Actinomycetota bacterium]
MRRREARQRALEILYQVEITQDKPETIIETYKKIKVEIPEFTIELVDGVLTHLTEIDYRIDRHAERWSIERMPIVDRNILRMGIFEILFEQEIPVSVSINEAVELAKIYGTPDSSKFINGVLGAIATEVSKK